MKNRYFTFLVTSAFFFLTETSFACSVCGGGGSKEKLNAYLLTTGILGAMPIIMGILLFFFIRRANKTKTDIA